MFSRLINLAMVALLGASALPARGQAIADLLQKAQTGDAKAEFDLANAYVGGQGVPMNPAKGMEWLRKSADHGYAGAEVTLGALFQQGFKELQGSPDVHEAAKWFRKAARQQSKDPKHAANAQHDLSQLLVQGLISKQEADWRTGEPGTHVTNAKDTKKGPPPFSLAEVEAGLTGGITGKRMITLVNTYGVDFALTATARTRLTAKGADDNLLAAISNSHH
jgi:TPR repeat protein